MHGAILTPVDGRSESTLYDRVGGLDWFVDLVDRFYDLVEMDSVLRPLYPTELTEPRRHLALFLAQYWGGPPAYEMERGHPRLRRRHFPFAIGVAERDAWISHMCRAVVEAGLDRETAEEMLAYFESASTALINS